MNMMRQKIEGDDLRILMNKVDTHHNSFIDFKGFLQLLSAIEAFELAKQVAKAQDGSKAAESQANRRHTTRFSRLAADLAKVWANNEEIAGSSP